MSDLDAGAEATPTKTATAAVVVLFRPEGDLLGRLRRTQAQVALLIVVSNDSADGTRLAGLDPAALLHLCNASNLGLAKALNMGIQEAARRGFTWCLLLDDDTLVDEDLVAGLAEVHRAYPQPQRIGALVANYRSPESGRLAYPAGPAWQDVAAPVTSGTLLALRAVRRVGGMREAFFIECIDIEFALRLRAADLRLIASGRPLMTHGAGEALERRFFGRVVLIGNHAPWRCFLQYRNLTWTLLRYVVREPRWAAQSVAALFKKSLLVLLYERDRPAKLWAMCRGVCAGIGWFVTGGAGSPAVTWK